MFVCGAVLVATAAATAAVINHIYDCAVALIVFFSCAYCGYLQCHGFQISFVCIKVDKQMTSVHVRHRRFWALIVRSADFFVGALAACRRT